jgi:hypothetical protein
MYGIYNSCEFPKWGQYLLANYMIIMLILFSNFYLHEYIKKSNELKKKRALGESESKSIKSGDSKKRPKKEE